MKTKLESIRDLLSGAGDGPALDSLRLELQKPDSNASLFMKWLKVEGERTNRFTPETSSRENSLSTLAFLFRENPEIAMWWPLCGVVGALFCMVVGTLIFAAIQLSSSRNREMDLAQKNKLITKQLQDNSLSLQDLTDKSASVLGQALDRERRWRTHLGEAYLQLLGDADPTIRRQAIANLARIGKVPEPVAQSLRKHLMVEKDAKVLNDLTAALEKIESEP